MKTFSDHINVPLASDIMTPNIQTLLPDTLIPIAIHEILTRKYSEMPIVNADGQYLGMFSEKCCMRVLASLVELIDTSKRDPPKASNVMVPREKLFTLDPGEDVFVAMSSLLAMGYSGAPVIAANGEFLGIFSERTCLGFITEAAYSEIPTANVGGFIDPDCNRLIDAGTDLHTIAKIFVETSYARLPVLHEGRIVGQISRRDVLNHSKILSRILRHRLDLPRTERESSLPAADTYLAAYGMLSDHSVSAFADMTSRSIDPEMDLFSVAQLFFQSPCRRFSVLLEGRLIGQISRSDILRHAIRLLK
ncbi:CBS domain-containing protein [Roseiconus lacunae]|uniref:CBS domain-containing protein n=1 Tax=Roseiconus lacunae TaxID=2605694 RepID=UPI003086742E|nr:CBS domain-containing protein [Stieleria sp. HD01]